MVYDENVNTERKRVIHHNFVAGKPLRVGNKPGVTRALETKIRVSDDPLVFLIDTPGIMLPNVSNFETGMKLAACGKCLCIIQKGANYHCLHVPIFFRNCISFA